MESIWSQFLKSAERKIDTPQGEVVILGSAGRARDEFIKQLCQPNKLQNTDQTASGVVSGYTFLDYLDAYGDRIAGLGVHFVDLPLTQDHHAVEFVQQTLLRTNYTSNEKALACILLDWNDDVREWASVVSFWVDLLKKCTNDDTWKQSAAEKNEQISYRFRVYTSPNSDETYGSVELPLGEGECDDLVGIDVVIALMGSEKALEYESANELGVDYIQQFIRLVSLKYGASVISIPYNTQSSLRDLISERLEIPLNDEMITHRAAPSALSAAKLVVPAGWDSWTRIRTLRDDFDTKALADSWHNDRNTAISKYVATVERCLGSFYPTTSVSAPAHVGRIDFDEFLESNYEALSAQTGSESDSTAVTTGSGPDYNIAGIQVDAMTDILQRLKSRRVTPLEPTAASTRQNSDTSDKTVPNPHKSDEVLQSFFEKIIKSNTIR